MLQRWSPCNWLRRVHPPVSSSSKRCIFEEASDWWIRWGYFDSIALELSTGFFFEFVFCTVIVFFITYIVPFCMATVILFCTEYSGTCQNYDICRRGCIDDTKCTETRWMVEQWASKPVRTRSQSFILLQLCIVGTKFRTTCTQHCASWPCLLGPSLEH